MEESCPAKELVSRFTDYLGYHLSDRETDGRVRSDLRRKLLPAPNHIIYRDYLTGSYLGDF